MPTREAEVCIVGAGFAGLAAARTLVLANREVVVLEARDRVGGRVWNRESDTGLRLSVGGTWLGEGQRRMVELCREYGLDTYPQHLQGDNIVRLDDVNHRYHGLIPKIGTAAVVSLGIALKRLERMTRRLPLAAPWDAPHAAALDARTLASWIDDPRNVPSPTARTMLHATMQLLFCTEPSEVSLLGSLVLARGGDGFDYYIDAKKTETDLVVGGVPDLADRMADGLGDRVVLDCPVRRIAQRDDGVDVVGDAASVQARHVIVATPPALAAGIDYDPSLPAAHAHLLRRMVPGSMIRVHAVYETPFWREHGLSGEAVSPSSPLTVTIDQTPRSGRPGVLSGYLSGANAVSAAALDPVERRSICLGALADCFGPEAASPIDYLETDWAAERWSGGAMIAHFPPGALTSYGPALRQPVGRIHWASSERATLMHGLMEGAVRSGESAATEVLAAG